MLALALRGLAARKLRGALTAFAILLGVAMVAGTFMLKGSLDTAFDDIFAERERGHRRLGRARGTPSTTGFDLPDAGRRAARELVDEVEGVDGVEQAVGRRSATTRTRSRSSTRTATGSARRRAARRTSPTASLPEPFNPFTYTEGAEPADRRRGRDRLVHRRGGGLRGRRHDPDQRPSRAHKDYTLSGIGRFGTGRAARRRQPGRLHARRGPADHRQGGRFDAIDVEAADGVSPGGAVATGSTPRCRATSEAKTGEEHRRRGLRRHQGRLLLPDDGAARLRRDLGLRRRLPDLQHVLDHGRPAHARVRDAADARRLLAAGARERRRSRRSCSGILASIVGIVLGLRLRQAASPAPSRRSASSCRSRASSCRAAAIIAPLIVGVVSTLVSAIVPALRATRVTPLEALRDTADGGRRRRAPPRVWTAANSSSLGGRRDPARALRRPPRFGRRPAAARARPDPALRRRSRCWRARSSSRSPRSSAARSRRFRGVTGRLARENTLRNPEPHGDHVRGADDRRRPRRLRGDLRRLGAPSRSTTRSTRPTSAT